MTPENGDYTELQAAMVILVAERRRLGLSRTHMVDALAVTQQHVSRVERGSNLTFDLVERYANAVGLTLDVRVVRVATPPEGQS